MPSLTPIDILEEARREVLERSHEPAAVYSVPGLPLEIPPLTSRIPGLVGKVLVKFRKLGYRLFAKWALEPLVLQQGQIVARHEYRIGGIDALAQQITTVSEQVASLEGVLPILENLGDLVATLGDRIASLEAGFPERSGERPAFLPVSHGAFFRREASGSIGIAGDAESTGGRGDPEQAVDRGHSPISNYSAFMHRFQAPHSELVVAFEHYVERYFRNVRGTIADLGCGKGPFLEAAARHGLVVVGVDSDPDNIAACKEKGFEAVLGDLFSYLEWLPDQWLGGVFLAQVIEHLDVLSKFRLVPLLRRKLCSGGVVVVETPNTSSSRVMTTMYYLDPTHAPPLHPEAYRELFEVHGFRTQDCHLMAPFEGLAETTPVPERHQNLLWVGINP